MARSGVQLLELTFHSSARRRRPQCVIKFVVSLLRFVIRWAASYGKDSAVIYLASYQESFNLGVNKTITEFQLQHSSASV